MLKNRIPFRRRTGEYRKTKDPGDGPDRESRQNRRSLEETVKVEQETTAGTTPEKTADKKQGLEIKN